MFNLFRLFTWLKQQSLANTKVSARQSWYIGRDSLNRPRVPWLRIAQEYQRNLYTVENYLSAQQFHHWQCGSVFIRLAVVASEKCHVAQNSEKIWTYSSSKSPKVDDFGTNRKRICDFLLVINSNFGTILHRFWDTATYWLKIAYFHTPLLFASLLPIFPLEFQREVKRQKTRVMVLLCGEGGMILTSTAFDWSIRVTDTRTDDSIKIARYSIYVYAVAC